jgi:hypothetical protein
LWLFYFHYSLLRHDLLRLAFATCRHAQICKFIFSFTNKICVNMCVCRIETYFRLIIWCYLQQNFSPLMRMKFQWSWPMICHLIVPLSISSAKEGQPIKGGGEILQNIINLWEKKLNKIYIFQTQSCSFFIIFYFILVVLNAGLRSVSCYCLMSTCKEIHD